MYFVKLNLECYCTFVIAAEQLSGFNFLNLNLALFLVFLLNYHR